ncbi:MAG: 3-hydroxyacyl-CoA dehydrogenase family protein [Deltaproteobacteria bacterium]|nr:3-hydroxyacyl-CoA dehydrogenase family protein [Deltaproteobacteria bacterium]
MGRPIKAAGVAGAGTMGAGIAQVFALHGYTVTLADRSVEALRAAIDRVKEHTDPALWEKIDALIKTSTDLNDLGGSDIVIEAVYEDMKAKKEVLKALDKVCGKDAIIATNTSSISITRLGRYVSNPGRFIGMHFMNPPKVMRLVEVIAGRRTSVETVETVTGLAQSLDKAAAVVKDSPGFVTNRLLFSLIGEAIRTLEKGIATKEDIDVCMRHGMNHPMGPIELADFIGLDICMETMENIHEGLGDKRFRPPRTLKRLVKEGKLGRKTKEGFYKYE